MLNYNSFLVLRTTRSSSYPVNVLVTLTAVLGKVYTRPEHTADISVTFIKSFPSYRLNIKKYVIGDKYKMERGGVQI